MNHNCDLLKIADLRLRRIKSMKNATKKAPAKSTAKKAAAKKAPAKKKK